MPWIVSDDLVLELEEGDDVFSPDAISSYNIDLGWDKTRHPVGRKFVKSDAISKQPKRVILEGCVAGRATRKDGNDPLSGAVSRTAAACDLIEQMGDARDCVTIFVGDKQFQNMVLVAAPIRWDVGDKLTFTLEFEELQTFGVSETFIAQIAREVEIGEVSTSSGQPTNTPTEFIGDRTPQDIQSLLDEFGQTSAFTDLDNCGSAGNTACIDDIYGGI